MEKVAVKYFSNTDMEFLEIKNELIKIKLQELIICSCYSFN